MATVRRDGLVLDAKVGGPEDGEAVLLLHGFPQHASSWDEVATRLQARGLRTIALEQRGYARGARPRRRRDYRAAELLEDAAAAIDQLAGGRAHVVGHDWGAAAAWALAAEHPERVASLTALSVPHPLAFLRSMLTSSQALHSWYMAFFQLPWLPEQVLRRRWTWFLEDYAGQTPQAAARDRGEFDHAGLTGAINWYRGLPFLDPGSTRRAVTVPTLLAWGDGDRFVSRAAVDGTAARVTGPYRLEVLEGVGHWIPEQVPDRTAELVAEQVAAASRPAAAVRA